MLDGIFGAEHFRNELTWKRTFAHGNVGRNCGSIVDHVFFYSKGGQVHVESTFHDAVGGRDSSRVCDGRSGRTTLAVGDAPKSLVFGQSSISDIKRATEPRITRTAMIGRAIENAFTAMIEKGGCIFQ